MYARAQSLERRRNSRVRYAALAAGIALSVACGCIVFF